MKRTVWMAVAAIAVSVVSATVGATAAAQRDEESTPAQRISAWSGSND